LNEVSIGSKRAHATSAGLSPPEVRRVVPLLATDRRCTPEDIIKTLATDASPHPRATPRSRLGAFLIADHNTLCQSVSSRPKPRARVEKGPTACGGHAKPFEELERARI